MKSVLTKPEKGQRLITGKNVNPRNPRKITPGQLQGLSESLKRFGDLGGIILNRKTGHLVGGHQRISAFEKAEVAATVTEELKRPDRTGTIAYGFINLNGTRYSYREVIWDEPKELTANIAANKIGGDFDDRALAILLTELNAKVPIEHTGFTPEELTKLLASTNGASAARKRAEGRQSDDEYSLFELVMLHDNKRRLVATLDSIRNDNNIKTLEEALMKLCDAFDQVKGTKTDE